MTGWIRGECDICGVWDYGSWESVPAGFLVKLGRVKYARYPARRMVRVFVCHHCQGKYKLMGE